jgi:hypothetical protein
MREVVRLLLTLLLAGVAVTVIGAWLAWWFEEERRLKRLVTRALGGDFDAAIVAKGRGQAAGFRVETEQMVVMSRGGADALLYRLDHLDGAELLIDHQVAARVFRGDGRRSLDKVEQAPQDVTLRLIFNDVNNPDFDLELWKIEDLERRHSPVPGKVVQEARSWIGRIDALVRRSPQSKIATPAAVAAPAAAAAPAMEAPPWDDDEDDAP